MVIYRILLLTLQQQTTQTHEPMNNTTTTPRPDPRLDAWVYPLSNITMLEGPLTINGQLIARKQALKHCLSPRAKQDTDHGLLQGWIESHLEAIEQLEALK